MIMLWFGLNNRSSTACADYLLNLVSDAYLQPDNDAIVLGVVFTTHYPALPRPFRLQRCDLDMLYSYLVTGMDH